MVIEEFRVRPVAHNAFTRGETIKLIGSLEYAASEKSVPVHFAPPADPLTILHLPIGRPVVRWRQRWPKLSDYRWHHALSAWRVLGHHLLNTDRQLLLELEHVTATDCSWTNTLSTARVAPRQRWILP